MKKKMLLSFAVVLALGVVSSAIFAGPTAINTIPGAAKAGVSLTDVSGDTVWIGGKVVKCSPNLLTIATRTKEMSFSLDSQTKVGMDNDMLANDIDRGDYVLVSFSKTDSVMPPRAREIKIEEHTGYDRVRGTVVAVNGNTLTVNTSTSGQIMVQVSDATNVTVHPSGAMTYRGTYTDLRPGSSVLLKSKQGTNSSQPDYVHVYYNQAGIRNSY